MMGKGMKVMGKGIGKDKVIKIEWMDCAPRWERIVIDCSWICD